MTALPKAYSVPRALAPTDLFLDGNEGRGPDPGFAARVLADGAERLRRYPDAAEVTGLLAERCSVDPGQVLVTAGGDDALDRICRVGLRGGGEVILPRPGFEMIARYAALAGGAVVDVPWTEPRYPTASVLRAIGPRTRIVVVTSPNNPTGGFATADDLRAIATATDGLVLVDLAYAEFADEDLTAAALELPNAVVVRTLSKAWGLAGIRVGYALSNPARIAELRAAGAPYAVAGPSLLLAAARLRDEAAMIASVQRVRFERADLTERLRALGAAVPDSQGNFVFARVSDPLWVRDAMAGLGIAIRAFPGVRGLEDAIRITCPADPDSYERMIAALEAVFAPQAWLFDLDGVIADVSRSYREAIRQTAARFGAGVGPDEIDTAKAAGNANNDWKLTQRLLAVRGIEVGLDQVTAVFEEIYAQVKATESLLVDAEQLRSWAAERPLAVVTGRPRRDATEFLERFELDGVFEAVICMEDAPAKPSAEPVLGALAALGIERAWMIGDTPDDIVAARAAGVVPIGVNGDAAALTAAGAARVLEATADLGAVGRQRARASEIPPVTGRVGEFSRTTAETDVQIRVDLDGTGVADISTGIGMLDHLLSALARHGRIDLRVRCTGDLVVDDHHTAEDVAIGVGSALDRALGDRRGVTRFGSAMAPLDEALARAVVDLSGRPWPEVSLELRREMLGELATENIGHVLNSLAIAMRSTVHIDVLRGANDHHKAEAAFKAFALALRQAVRIDGDRIPSTKEVLG